MVKDKYQFMILQPSGNGGCLPDPEDWLPKENSKVVILNASGADQILANISDKLLKGDSGSWVSEIEIKDGEFWPGKSGGKRSDPGTYEFEDGQSSPAAGTRTGTIDPY